MSPERFAKLKKVLASRQQDLTLVTDGVHKSHNLAAIGRSAEAVGVARIHAAGLVGVSQRAEAFAGSGRWLEVCHHRDIGSALLPLKQNGMQILVAHLDAGAIDFRAANYCLPTAIVMGAELTGASAQACAMADDLIIIPMHGLTESLNVSVAAALILFEAQRQRQAAGLYQPKALDDQNQLFEWCYPKIAASLKAQNRPYPALDEDGFIIP